MPTASHAPITRSTPPVNGYQSNTPVPVSESCGATRVSAGDVFTCAVESLGQVACWGANGSGELGIGGYVERWAPVTVHDLAGMATVTSGGQHACAVGNGRLHCWGANYGYQLGDGTTLPRTEPRPVFLQDGAVKPDTDCTYSEYDGHGYYFCRNAASWASARDKCRAAGVGMELVRVNTPGENEFMAEGLSSNAWLGGNDRTTEGEWYWAEAGSDNGTQFWHGKGTSQGGSAVGGLHSSWVDSWQPDDAGGADCAETDINGNWFDTVCTVTKHFVCEGATVATTEATVVSGDGVHTCALDDTGDVWCWGTNSTGQIGDGTTTTRKLPVKTSPLAADATDVSAGGNFTCAVLSDASGHVTCWGAGANGQLGDGTTAQKTSSSTNVTNVSGAVQVSAGWRHACAAHADGQARCWGLNTFGALGNGTTTQSTVGVTVRVDGTTDPLTDVAKVTAGQYHSCALQNDGDVWCWGYNLLGRLGDGTQTNRHKAVPVSLPDDAIDITAGLEHTCATLVTRETFCWGANGAGKLGNGTATYSTTPVAAGGLDCRRTVDVAIGDGSLGGDLTCGDTEGMQADSLWPVAGVCPTRHGVSAKIGTRSGTQNWEVSLGGDVVAGAVIDDEGVAYVGSASGEVRAVRANGTTKWSVNVGAAVRSSGAIAADGSLYVGADDGILRKLSGVDGSTTWTFNTGGQIRTALAIGPTGIVYFGTSGAADALHAVDADGNSVWTTPASTDVLASPLIAFNRFVLFVNGSSLLYMAPTTSRDGAGLQLASVELGGTPGSSSPVSGAGDDVFVGRTDGVLVSVHLPGARIQWTKPLPCAGSCSLGTPAASPDGSRVFVGASNGTVYAVSRLGELQWEYATGGGVEGAPAVDRTGVIYVGSAGGKVLALNNVDEMVSRQLWEANLGVAVRAPLAIGLDGAVVVGADDAKVHSIGTHSTTCPGGLTCGVLTPQIMACVEDGIFSPAFKTPPECGAGDTCPAGGACLELPSADRVCFIPCEP